MSGANSRAKKQIERVTAKNRTERSGALKDITDFRKGEGHAFRQKLKEVDAKKLKKAVELLGLILF